MLKNLYQKTIKKNKNKKIKKNFREGFFPSLVVFSASE